MNEPDWTQDTLSYGETLGPAMEIETEDEASRYFARYCRWIMRVNAENDKFLGLKEAQDIAKTNIGYYSGYFGEETQRRVERVFKCVHPFFGSVDGPPKTPEDILKLGQELGERSKNGESIMDHAHAQSNEVPKRMTRGDFLDMD